MYVGVTYARLVYNWYQNIFYAIAVLIVFHAANEKPEEKKNKTRQQIKKGRSELCCRCQSTWLIIAPLSQRYRSDVAPLLLSCRSVDALLSHRYCTTIVPLLLHCCCSVVTLLLHRYHTAIPPLSLRCCRSCCRYAVAPLSFHYRATLNPLLSLLLLLRSRTAIAPLLLRFCSSLCRYAVAPLSHRYRATVAPLLSLLLSLRSRTAIAPLSRLCRTAVTPAHRGYKQFNIELMLLYCHFTVASAVDRKVHTVVASRGIIRVTVTISDFQARVSSSSEGCSTSQKTVKVETY